MKQQVKCNNRDLSTVVNNPNRAHTVAELKEALIRWTERAEKAEQEVAQYRMTEQERSQCNALVSEQLVKKQKEELEILQERTAKAERLVELYQMADEYNDLCLERLECFVSYLEHPMVVEGFNRYKGWKKARLDELNDKQESWKYISVFIDGKLRTFNVLAFD